MSPPDAILGSRGKSFHGRATSEAWALARERVAQGAALGWLEEHFNLSLLERHST